MAFAIILLETFALYLMIMACIHTDILEMRLKKLGDRTIQADDMDDDERHRKEYLRLIECSQTYADNLR